jgi:hypothetical protein
VQAQQLGVYSEVWEALREVQRNRLVGDAVHLAEDGGLKPGELGKEGRGQSGKRFS